MTQWQGKSKGNTAGYKIFIFLLKTTGTGGAYLLLRLVAYYYLIFSGNTSRPIMSFYTGKLGFDKQKARKMLYKNYCLLGQSIIDKVAIISGIKTDFTFNFDGEEHLHEMVKRGKGGLLISGHLGSWEAAGHLLKRINTNVYIVMYDGERESIKNYMEAVTEGKTFHTIYLRKDLSHIYEITAALAGNGIVCMHADRFRPEHKTISCHFFNEPALFPEGPFLLASKLKVPCVYVYAFKESDKHYHFYSTPIKDFSGNSINEVAEDYVSHLEQMTRQYPEHWFNYYNFWNHEHDSTT